MNVFADLRIRSRSGAIEVPLRVQPRARKNEVTGVHNGALKVKTTAPPVEGAANREIVKFFAGLLRLPRSRLSIVSGDKSRDKLLRIEEIDAEYFLQALGKQ